MLPPAPQPRSQMVAFVVSESLASIGDSSNWKAVAATPSLSRHSQSVVERIKQEAGNILDSRYGGTKYSFIPPDTCSEDYDSDEYHDIEETAPSGILKQLPKEIFRDLKRPSDFQRLDAKMPTKFGQGGSIIKDLTKVKMSILSPTTSYSMFSNQSSESLDSQQGCMTNTKLSDLPNPSTPDLIPLTSIQKSDSQSTFQSYSCSSRNSTLSSNYRQSADRGHLVDLREDARETEDELRTMSGYSSLECLEMIDTRLSLTNPHYTGHQSSDEDQHSSYAEALKCPLNEGDTYLKEKVQLREKKPKSFNVRPKSEITSSNFNCDKVRPLSEVCREETVRAHTMDIVMYVIGGREVGQVNIFNRNISIWKLKI